MNWRERTDQWINEYPHVFAMFEKFALEMLRKGAKFGINLLRERVRWECLFVYGTKYKFCNTMSPYVARRLIERHPDLRPVIKCKRTKW